MTKKNITLLSSLLILLVACGNDDSSSSGAGGNVNVDCAKFPCFFSVTAQGGNLGGVSGADALCQKKHSTAKAFIIDGDKRSANPQVDWVLDPNTAYYQMDGTLIGTTNGTSLFSFPLTAALLSTPNEYWTGMNTDYSSSQNCTKWTAGGVGQIGVGNSATNWAISRYNQSCDRTDVLLLCVAD